MKNFIVITSIFPPSKAIKKYSQMTDYKLIVIGDKKSPSEWDCNNVDYLSIEQQSNLDYKLIDVLPYNHYCRKMIGYLKAINQGAEIIVDTDDDNIPTNNWEFPNFSGDFELVTNQGFINIYQLFTKQKIWPRGLPLNLINEKYTFKIEIEKKSKVGVWQSLANEDPDVDAIYRLTCDEPCFFEERLPIVLGYGSICPFNTQNTIIRKELFPLLYLPTYVSFRFTDILRGLIAQPIMWLYGYKLGFANATVIQKRNPHDYMKDFISEIPMYENCEKVIEVVKSSISDKKTIESNLYDSYNSLLKEDIVCKQEMVTLEAWLNDIEKMKGI